MLRRLRADQGFKRFSPNFRFTITVGSQDEVARAHDWLKASAKERGVSELADVQTRGSVSSFLVGAGGCCAGGKF